MKTFFQAFRLFLVLTVITGVVYPLAVTAIAQTVFPYQANGSVLKKDGKLIGSELLAQKFQGEGYFWSRPSAVDFATVPSGAGNQGPTSAALKELAAEREKTFRTGNSVSSEKRVPSEMIFASASGLDPHISPEAARLQVQRVAKARNVNEERLYKLVDDFTERPQFGILGESRVNILRLNIALDSL